MITTIAVTVAISIAVAAIRLAAPAIPRVFALMLQFDGIICFVVLVVQITVQLRMLPRAQALLVRVGMFSLQLIMNITMLIVELLVVAIVMAPLCIRACRNGKRH